MSRRFLELVPRDFARQHLIVSQGGENGVELLAISATSDPAAVFNVGVRLRAKVEAFEADPESIARLIDEAYGSRGRRPPTPLTEGPAEGVQTPNDEIEALLAEADRDLLSTQGKGPVVKLVDALLFEALQRARATCTYSRSTTARSSATGSTASCTPCASCHDH